jgi:hypothetical protein
VVALVKQIGTVAEFLAWFDGIAEPPKASPRA